MVRGGKREEWGEERWRGEKGKRGEGREEEGKRREERGERREKWEERREERGEGLIAQNMHTLLLSFFLIICIYEYFPTDLAVFSQ